MAVKSPRAPQQVAAVTAFSIGLGFAAVCAPSVASAAVAGPAQHAALQDPAYAPAAPAPAGPIWQVSVSPYIWFAGLKGDLGGPGRLPDVHLDNSFGDIAQALHFGAMVMGAARYDRFVAVGDLIYISISRRPKG
jgi:hypothetical protein